MEMINKSRTGSKMNFKKIKFCIALTIMVSASICFADNITKNLGHVKVSYLRVEHHVNESQRMNKLFFRSGVKRYKRAFLAMEPRALGDFVYSLESSWDKLNRLEIGESNSFFVKKISNGGISLSCTNHERAGKSVSLYVLDSRGIRNVRMRFRTREEVSRLSEFLSNGILDK